MNASTVATVDLDALIATHLEVLGVESCLKDRFEPQRIKLSSLQSECELAHEKVEASGDEESRDEAMQAAEQLCSTFEEMHVEFISDLEAAKQEYVQQSYQRIQSLIAEYSEQHGITAVIAEGAVFAVDTADITPRIAERLKEDLVTEEITAG